MQTKMKTGIYSFSALLVIFLIVISSCDLVGEQGSGNVIKQDRKVSGFTSLDVSGAFKVYLSQGATQSVIIEADDNLMDKIETEVVGGKLRISTKHHIINAKSLKVYITATQMESIELSGAVDLQTQTRLSGTSLSVDVSGASDSKIELAVQKLEVSSSGGSSLQLIGTATEVKMDVSGAVDLHAFDLLTEKFNLSMSGAGEADINVKNELNADISGAASVRYKGNPAKLVEDISGAGSVRKAD